MGEMGVLRRALWGAGMVAMAGATVAGAAGEAAAAEIDELRAELRRLQQRIEQLEVRRGTEVEPPEQPFVPRAEYERLQEQILAMEAPDKPLEDVYVKSGTDKLVLALAGQVNRAVLFADDGIDAEVFHVDNDASSTRIRLIGAAQLTDQISAGSQIEVQFESNSSAAVTIRQDAPAGPDNFTERKLEVYLDHDRGGRLWLGQGDTASNGSSEIDLSGTAVVGYSDLATFAGGLEFRNEATNAFGPSIGAVFSNMDGLSRDDRARYDTPLIAGFQGSVSHVDGGSWDVAGTYTRELPNGMKVAAALAYANASSRQGFQQYNGSASVLLPNGFSVTGAAGARSLDVQPGRDPFFYYAKLGYAFRALPFGTTVISADYAFAEDVAQNGDEFTGFGVQAVQNLDDAATELYIGARMHELERPGASFDDIFAVMAGVRVKF